MSEKFFIKKYMSVDFDSEYLKYKDKWNYSSRINENFKQWVLICIAEDHYFLHFDDQGNPL